MDLLGKIQRLKIVDGLLVLGFLLVIMGIGINFRDQFLEKNKTELVTKEVNVEENNDVQVASEVTIDISGEVKKPGVYKLQIGSILDDVLIKAGGLTDKANLDWIEQNLNKAEKLYDGQKIYIPNEQKDKEVILGLSTAKTVVRINSATVEELDKLDGVGPAIAQRIIDYRTEMGGFKSVEEIKLVPGIGDKMFEKIKDEIQL